MRLSNRGITLGETDPMRQQPWQECPEKATMFYGLISSAEVSEYGWLISQQKYQNLVYGFMVFIDGFYGFSWYFIFYVIDVFFKMVFMYVIFKMAFHGTQFLFFIF